MKKENESKWIWETTNCKSQNEKYNHYNKNRQFLANINKAQKIDPYNEWNRRTAS